MGDSCEIWQETGQLASCCTSIYRFLLIWFTDSLNICKNFVFIFSHQYRETYDNTGEQNKKRKVVWNMSPDSTVLGVTDA